LVPANLDSVSFHFVDKSAFVDPGELDGIALFAFRLLQ
jgi:hypothetical protein